MSMQLRPLIAACLLSLVTLWSPLLAACPQSTASLDAATVQKLIADAKRELAAKSSRADIRKWLEDAYAGSEKPSPELLLYLGQLAYKEGRLVEAADYYQRYRSLVKGEQPEAPAGERVLLDIQSQLPIKSFTRIIISASYPGGPSKRSLLCVDGRLIGALPLADEQLLVPWSSKHEFVWVSETTTKSEIIDSMEHGNVKLKFTASAAQLKPEKGLAINIALVFGASISPALQPGAQTGIKDRLKQIDFHTLDSIPPELIAEARAQPIPHCLLSTAAARRGQELGDMEFLALIDASSVSQTAPQDFMVTVHIFDLAAGEHVLRLDHEDKPDGSSQRCLLADIATCAGDLVARAAITIVETRRPLLNVKSTPNGATLKINDCVRGKTPAAQIPVFAVEREPTVSVALPGYATESRKIRLYAPDTEEFKLRRTSRPPWRLGVGVGFLAGGGGLLGIGAAGLAKDGTCYDLTLDPQCSLVFDTKLMGGALSGAGLALMLAGAVVIAWPVH